MVLHVRVHTPPTRTTSTHILSGTDKNKIKKTRNTSGLEVLVCAGERQTVGKCVDFRT